jgi:hypothetical protein
MSFFIYIFNLLKINLNLEFILVQNLCSSFFILFYIILFFEAKLILNYIPIINTFLYN